MDSSAWADSYITKLCIYTIYIELYSFKSDGCWHPKIVRQVRPCVSRGNPVGLSFIHWLKEVTEDASVASSMLLTLESLSINDCDEWSRRERPRYAGFRYGRLRLHRQFRGAGSFDAGRFAVDNEIPSIQVRTLSCIM